MTILQAITRIDGLMHNTYSMEDKVEWLSRLDGIVKRLILDAHEGPEVSFYGYDPNEGLDIDLLVPAPFDEMYLRWLEAQIHYTNGEYDKYNNAILMYQTAYDAYANYYRRSHRPKQTVIRYF